MNALKPSILGFDPQEFIREELTLATLSKPLADKAQSIKDFSSFSKFSSCWIFIKSGSKWHKIAVENPKLRQ